MRKIAWAFLALLFCYSPSGWAATTLGSARAAAAKSSCDLMIGVSSMVGPGELLGDETPIEQAYCFRITPESASLVGWDLEKGRARPIPGLEDAIGDVWKGAIQAPSFDQLVAMPVTEDQTVEDLVMGEKYSDRRLLLSSTHSELAAWFNAQTEKRMPPEDPGTLGSKDVPLPEPSRSQEPPGSRSIPPANESRGPLPSDQGPNSTKVRIFFATDRKYAGGNVPAAVFSEERSDGAGKLTYGTADISIPKSHKLGELETPSIYHFEFSEDPAHHVILQSVNVVEQSPFFQGLHNRVLRSGKKEAFVFVHGFNVSFQEAARRTAQLAYDLRFDGAPILYSWPSRRLFEWGGYTTAEANAQWSYLHLSEFLREVAERSGARRIHLIAHSMGNRALTQAIKELSETLPKRKSGPVFGQVILAAPDVDADTFLQIASAVSSLSERTTIYSSDHDQALGFSKSLHAYLRLGQAPMVIPGIDSVDVSSIDHSLLGHGYYGENPTVLGDFLSLLLKDLPPNSRSHLEEVKVADGAYYWKMEE